MKKLTASELILVQNMDKTFDNIPDYSKAEKDEKTSGIYHANDEYGISHYFRGKINNNYVSFGGNLWRIIRINGNNTIRMIADAESSKEFLTCSSESGMYFAGHIPSIGNCQMGGTAFASYNEMGMGSCFEHQLPASYDQAYIKLMEWFENWTGNNTNEEIINYLADEPFCNDINLNMIPAVSSRDYTEGFIRLSYFDKPSPTLECPNTQSKYTVGNHGNGKLQYPVGLITADETFFAGGTEGEKNTEYYLHNGKSYYTMTLKGMFSDKTSSHHDYQSYSSNQDYYAIDKDGEITSFVGDYYIIPVLNLKSDTIFTGKGTKNNPYKISQEEI